MGFFANIFGTQNERTIKTLWPRVHAITALEPQIQKLTDEQLAARIAELKKQISAAVDAAEKAKGTLKRDDINAILDSHLNEVFAIVRESGKRVMNMRHFDVQLLGGMALHQGKISEMKTGEGKTLTATLPAVLNALTGRGVHIITVNDYLASRDAEWMGRIYRFLGLTVGVVLPQTSDRLKKVAYACDITHGQNNEFGFDYLRDNMKFSLSEYVQRGHNFAIVDEVDSILIDEARTPLIISGPAEESSEKYKLANTIVPRLRKDSEYTIDEKSRVVMLTEPGVEKCEQLLEIENLYDPVNLEILHHLTQSLRAHSLYKRDVDYVIENGQVVIVDEHTGRLMYGRRWSDGLHQAIEAKENVRIQAENHTLATITFQNYFRMYQKLSGMTGTADTEAEEFAKIYDLDVVVIPTNKPQVRKDENDLVFKTEIEKVNAIVKDLEATHAKGQPALVGTVSVEKSEVLSKRLIKLGIPHNVLNAKKHRDEAAIVSQAGRVGAVTIATNMAGRGTDIILGGDPEFMARTEVAKHFSQGEEQIAQFAFLTGKPEMVNTQRLAERDSNDAKFLTELEEQAEAIKAEGQELPEDFPKTLEQAKARIMSTRKEFYDAAVKVYRDALGQTEKVSSEEKRRVMEAGGLRIIGTERHESRRIDNQLRGRSGRQGDPGSSAFYLCLQDDLMRIFGSDRMIGVMEKLGMEDDMPIEHPWVTKSIANAQKRVEGFHFDSRKQLIEYDDVMNQQRNAVYALRRKVLGGENIRELIFDLVEQAVVSFVTAAAPEKTSPNEWKLEDLSQDLLSLTGVRIDFTKFNGDRNDLMDLVFKSIEDFYNAKEKDLGADLVRQVERVIYLQAIDQRWKEHLQAMDHLREGIHFRGYAQKDPKQEYKREGFTYFVSMMARIRLDVLERVMKAEVQQGTRERVAQDLSRLEASRREEAARSARQQVLGRGEQAPSSQPAPQAKLPARNTTPDAAQGMFARRGLPKGEAEPHLNRHQRRLMKAAERKTGRPGAHSE